MIIQYIVVFLVLLASASTFLSGFRTRAYNAVAKSTKPRRISNNTDTSDTSTGGTRSSTNSIQTGDGDLASDQKSYISDIKNHLPAWLQTYHSWHANQLAKLDELETELLVAANGRTAADISSDVIRNRTQQFRFLVVVCLNGVTCGGLSDRIKAIPYWLIRANQTNRILLLHWAKNDIPLEAFWEPPPGGLNWSVPRPKEGGGSSVLSRLLYDETLRAHSCLSKRRGDRRLHRASRPIPGGSTGGRQVVCSHHQTYHFERSRDDMEKYRTELHENSYSYAFHTMFQPSHKFSAYLERTLQGPDLGLELDKVRYATHTPYLAVHIRSKYPLRWKKGELVRPSMAGDREVVQYIADHAIDKLVRKYVDVTGTVRIPPIYVASDSSDVVRYLKYNSTRYGINGGSAAELGEPRRILNISEDIQIQAPRIMGLESLVRPHIEFINVVANEAEKQSEKDVASVSDLYPAFLDLWMLTASRCIASGVGGYGRLGYFLSTAASDCYTVHRKKKKYKDVQADAKEYRQSIARNKYIRL